MKKKEEYHSGELTLQGTRYPDILKLWLSLQHLGNYTYSKLIQNSFKFTNLLKRELNKIKNIKFAFEPETNILCFKYAPNNISLNENDLINLKLQE